MTTRLWTRRRRTALWGALFVLPFFALVAVFQLVPIASTIGLAFTDRKGASTDEHPVGLDNFAKAGTNLALVGQGADDAHRLVGALVDAGLDAFTDAPEAAGEADPYALTTPVASDDAPADDTAADASLAGQDPPREGYTVRLVKQDAPQIALARNVLAAQGVAPAALDAALSPGNSGLLFDKFFWAAFGNTVLLFAMSFVPQFMLALLFAVWFSDTRLRLRTSGFYKALFYVPSILLTSAVVVFFSTLVTYPVGPLNSLLQALGGESVNVLRHDLWARVLLALIQFWLLFGTTLIYLSAGLLGIPATLVEAAHVDGARPRQVFWRITLPLLRPIVLFVFITSLISGLQLFDIPYLLGGSYGGYNGTLQTVAKYLYSLSFSSAYNLSYGATIATGLIVLTLALAAVVVRLLHSRDDEPGGAR